jgi:hypothetical protein
VTIKDKPVSDLTCLHDLQEELASTAGFVMTSVLLPEWQKETESLIFNKLRENQEGSEDAISTEKLEPHVRAAEEFFVLPYLAFIQSILGRIRTIALGSLCLFVGTPLIVSSYPFDPLNILGAIFLAVFVIYGGLTIDSSRLFPDAPGCNPEPHRQHTARRIRVGLLGALACIWHRSADRTSDNSVPLDLRFRIFVAPARRAALK